MIRKTALFNTAMSLSLTMKMEVCIDFHPRADALPQTNKKRRHHCTHVSIHVRQTSSEKSPSVPPSAPRPPSQRVTSDEPQRMPLHTNRRGAPRLHTRITPVGRAAVIQGRTPSLPASHPPAAPVPTPVDSDISIGRANAAVVTCY